jgi:hypothetical protein
MLSIGVIVNAPTCLPEDLDIVTPSETQLKPATFYCDVVDTLQEAMCRNLIKGQVWGECFAIRPYHTQCITITLLEKNTHRSAFAKPKTSVVSEPQSVVV